MLLGTIPKFLLQLLFSQTENKLSELGVVLLENGLDSVCRELLLRTLIHCKSSKLMTKFISNTTHSEDQNQKLKEKDISLLILLPRSDKCTLATLS